MLKSQLPKSEKTLPASLKEKGGEISNCSGTLLCCESVCPWNGSKHTSLGGLREPRGCAAQGGGSNAMRNAALGGKRLLSSLSTCAGCLATAIVLAVVPPASFQLLQPFSCPVLGLRSVAHQVIRFARSTIVSLVRLQVLKPETDPLSACALDRTLLDGIPEAGNHHSRDGGCWRELRWGQLTWPKQFVSN